MSVKKLLASESHSPVYDEMFKLDKEELLQISDLLPWCDRWFDWYSSNSVWRWTESRARERLKVVGKEVLCSYIAAACDGALSKQLEKVVDLKKKEIEILKQTNEMLMKIKQHPILLRCCKEGCKAVLKFIKMTELEAILEAQK